MEFIDERLLDYCEAHTEHEPEVLRELSRETQAKVLYSRMLSGHLQGRFLSMISSLIRPRVVLEIGTYTGYSAICLCEGLHPEGKLITIDTNDELTEMVERFLRKAGFANQATVLVGDATKVIPTLSGPFDLVFIDADKENYSRYFDLVINKVPVGGLIIADNVLWSGQVLDEGEQQSHETRCIVSFNDKVSRDPRVKPVLVPVRDGLMLLQKISD